MPRNIANKVSPINIHCRFLKIFQLQSSAFLSLGEFRFDSLFDYGNELQDIDAANLVNDYYSYLMTIVQPHMQAENEMRKQTGYLTYPYFIPRWLPNAIET